MACLTISALASLGCSRTAEPSESSASPAQPAADAEPSPPASNPPAPNPPAADPMPAETEPPPAVQPPSDPAAEPADPPECLARYHIDSNDSVLDEQRRRGGGARWDDFAERYAAAYLDPDADHPVEAVAKFQIGQTPLLWFTADYSAAVVNAAVLTDLEVVNVTELRVGQREAVGALTELGQGKIDGRTLAEFLLRAGALLSYVHIGSQLCLLSENSDDQGVYEARFAGEHTYFTNEENVDAFGFAFELGADGAFAVTGIEAVPLPPARPVPSSP